MSRWLALIFLTTLCLGPGARADIDAWKKSIVVIEANMVEYSYYEPWSVSSRTVKKNGVVIQGKRILTTADWMQNSKLMRIQRGGRGAWWDAELDWVDYHANLALLSVKEPEFWTGTVEASLSEAVPIRGDVTVYRQSSGNLETWHGALSRIFVRKSQRSFVRYMTLEVTSDVDSSGWSEIVALNGELVGLTASQDGDRLLVIPAPLIRSVLAAKASDPSARLSHYDFVWQFTRNPAVASYLGLAGAPRGIVVTKVPETSAFAGLLEARDIILEIDGFSIDSDGDYEDPDYGHLSFRNLATRGHFAGDESHFVVWRDGEEIEIAVTLPAAEYADALVPEQEFDRAPEYLVTGGFIFQPLTVDYLRSWGAEWWRSAPYRLSYYTYEQPSLERPSLVILSHVLPDRFNLGYQDLSYMTVDKVNEQPITDLESLRVALSHPQGGFHIIEFFPNSGVQKLVLDALTLDEATTRIAVSYGIPRPYKIHPSER